MECLLCSSPSDRLFTDEKMKVSYWHCRNCDLRFMDPNNHLGPGEERIRYLNHESDVEDTGYQGFIAPLRVQIQNHVRRGACGLDFGCGRDPVFAQLLERDGYEVARYDLYFHPDLELLRAHYEFVYSVEAVEHFYQPRKEWLVLRECLSASGKLGIMTQIYSEPTDFATWYYRRDPTHVCFYSEKTFEWIRRLLKFNSVTFLDNKTIWFT